jgi:glutaredoxin 3
MAKSVLIYSTPTCPYCKLAKDYMKEQNVAFTEIDVAADNAKAEEMIQKSGQMGVPVIDVDGKIIIGFDKKALKEALGIK